MRQRANAGENSHATRLRVVRSNGAGQGSIKRILMRATSPDLSPAQLRTTMQESHTLPMRSRRGIFLASLLGIASMGAVSLYQLGAIRHLPDPPTRRPRFHSDKVNATNEAFSYGMPDGPLTIAAHGINIALAAAGPPDRYRRRPWLSFLATGVAAAQAAIAAKYLFHTMPKVDHAWCPYCITDALTHFATFGLTLPESRKAISHLRGASAPHRR